MSVNGKVDEVALDDLHAVGERNDVPGYRRLVRDVREAVDSWRTFAEEAELGDDVIMAIAEDIERFRPR